MLTISCDWRPVAGIAYHIKNCGFGMGPWNFQFCRACRVPCDNHLRGPGPLVVRVVTIGEGVVITIADARPG